MKDTNMLAVASSIQGYAHKKNNLPNQDTYSYLINDTHKIFVAIVSDGAGSASNAKLGSSLCCYHLTQALMDIAISIIEGKLSKSWYDEKIMLKISEHINFLSELQDNIKSFHHTMSAVIVSPIGGKIIQIGDSPVVVTLHQEDFIYQDIPNVSSSLVFDEQKQGEYANVTHFLTSPSWRNYIRIEELPKNTLAIFLMSDGAGAIFTPRKKLHEPALLEVFRRFKEFKQPINEILDNFLDMEEINAKTADDKTLIAYFPANWAGDSIFSEKYQPHNISPDIYQLIPARIEISQSSQGDVISDSQSESKGQLEPVINLPKKITDDKAYME